MYKFPFKFKDLFVINDINIQPYFNEIDEKRRERGLKQIKLGIDEDEFIYLHQMPCGFIKCILKNDLLTNDQINDIIWYDEFNYEDSVCFYIHELALFPKIIQQNNIYDNKREIEKLKKWFYFRRCPKCNAKLIFTVKIFYDKNIIHSKLFCKDKCGGESTFEFDEKLSNLKQAYFLNLKYYCNYNLLNKNYFTKNKITKKNNLKEVISHIKICEIFE